MIEAELVLGGLEAVLYRPAVPLDPHQGFDARPGRAQGREEGEVAISYGATDEQATRPVAGAVVAIFGRLEGDKARHRSDEDRRDDRGG